MRVSRDSLRSLFLFKSSRNNRARKAQTRPRAGTVVALCCPANHKYLHLHYPLESPAEETLRFVRIHLRTWNFPIDEAVTRKRLQNANSIGLDRLDWRAVFTVMTISRDNGLIFKRPKFLVGRDVYKLVDCLQLLPDSASGTEAVFTWELIKREFPRNSFV